MDEKTTEIVQSYMNVELVPKEKFRPSDYHRIPFSQFGAIGAGLASLFPAFRTVTERLPMNTGENLYRAVTAAGDPVKLQYAAKDGTGLLGGINVDGKLAQARFVKEAGESVSRKMELPINPIDYYMLGALVSISIRVDEIKRIQGQIFDFLEIDKRTEMEGTLAFLIDAFEKYKYNWNNEAYRANLHLKTQDVKQMAEHNILFYRRQIAEEMKKKPLMYSVKNVDEKASSLYKAFDNYQLAVYLSAFASFMEVMYLCNFDKPFLDDVCDTIETHSHQYMELYTDCYNLLERARTSSVESFILKGIAGASGGLGRFAEKVPVLNNTGIPENLSASEEKINDWSSDFTGKSLKKFSDTRSSMTRPFVEMTEAINAKHNQPSDFYFDDENLYIPLPI